MSKLRDMWEFLIKFPALHRAILAEFDEHNAKTAELQRQVEYADDARRHAQEVSSDLVKEKRALQAQLPEGMQDCTILFKECEKGHGRLTAENWVDHGCQTCQLAERTGERDEAMRHKEIEKALTNEQAGLVGSLQFDIACLRQLVGEFIEAWDHDGEPSAAAYETVIEKARAAMAGTSALSETVLSVTYWANETFGQATIWTQIQRAKKEFTELLAGNLSDTDAVAEEAADVCICLYRVIGTLDPEAIDKKMKKNRARKWLVDANGTAQHIKEGSHA